VYLGQDSLEASKQKPWYANIDRSKGEASTATADEFEKLKHFERSGYLEGASKVGKRIVSTYTLI